MTEPEKKLLAEQQQSLGIAVSAIHRSWHECQRVLTDRLADIANIQDRMNRMLRTSETGHPVADLLAEVAKAKGIIPAEAFSPGEYLADEIKARGWTLVDAASKHRLLTVPVLRELIAGTKPMTRTVAYVIADMLGQDDAAVWLKLQESYDAACAQRKDPKAT